MKVDCLQLIKRFERDVKNRGFFDYRIRQKALFFEKNHPGIYKKMAELNYKLMFKNGGVYRGTK